MTKTKQQFEEAIDKCRSVFLDKMQDYGTAWRILRPSSLTDQIYIKANRIRSIQIKGEAKVNEGIEDEFIAIVNYSVMAIIQLEKGLAIEGDDLSKKEIEKLYNHHIYASQSLMENKNHDYDEAWRNMRISSLDDIILMKLLRVKQIEDNQGKTTVSEGLEANYQDMINYALFALIKMAEEEQN
ncbi:MAG: DUF1599 domain-containing protein [Bacteroidales bacterium]|nr:DUF1599 domain-containing protein [Bacteroidales bacterium]